LAVIKILTYNTQGDTSKSLAQHFSNIKEFKEADIVTLQECPREDVAVAPSVAEFFSSAHILRSVNVKTGRPSYNVTLFKKNITVFRVDSVALESFKGRDILASVAKLRATGNCSLVTFLCVADGLVLKIGNVHLDVFGGTEHRRKQFLSFLNMFNSLQWMGAGNLTGKAVEVICGDFNTMSLLYGPWNNRISKRNKMRVLHAAEHWGFMDCTKQVPWTQDVFAFFDAEYSLYSAFKACKALGLSWHQKLDHILVRGAKSIVSSGVVLSKDGKHLYGSDHLPVYAEIEV